MWCQLLFKLLTQARALIYKNKLFLEASKQSLGAFLGAESVILNRAIFRKRAKLTDS